MPWRSLLWTSWRTIGVNLENGGKAAEWQVRPGGRLGGAGGRRPGHGATADRPRGTRPRVGWRRGAVQVGGPARLWLKRPAALRGAVWSAMHGRITAGTRWGSIRRGVGRSNVGRREGRGHTGSHQQRGGGGRKGSRSRRRRPSCGEQLRMCGEPETARGVAKGRQGEESVEREEKPKRPVRFSSQAPPSRLDSSAASPHSPKTPPPPPNPSPLRQRRRRSGVAPARMASAGGGGGATDEIPEVEMEVVERPPEEPGRTGLKRVRDPSGALGSYGFYGVTTAEKKPMVQPHVNAPRLNSPSPGQYPENKTIRATKICTSYAQGWCQNGKNCTFLHEIEGFGSAKAGLLAPAGSGNHRGSEDGSQVQHQSNLKVPQFKDAEGSSKHELYRNLVHVYGEDNERLAQKPTAPIGLAAEARRYLGVNTLNSDHQFQSSGMSISPDPLQFRGNLSAYGGTTDNLPNAHQKEHRSSHASYSSHNSTGFRNLGYAASEISLGSPSLRATSQLGIQSHHLFRTGSDKGCGTSRPALLSSSSVDLSIISAGSLSPIKDEVWETSVPFVPSFSFPTPPGSPYDPFVDCIEPPKVRNTDNLKTSKSFSISSQHTDPDVITDKSLNRDDKLIRNMSAIGANGPAACLIASDRGRSSSLDVNKRGKACDRKNDVASSNDKARDFRFHLAEHIKDLIKPIWKDGNLSKDAHKQVVKKSVEKVADSIEPNQLPTTKEMIAKYITTNESKIEKLVKAYVDRHRTA